MPLEYPPLGFHFRVEFSLDGISGNNDASFSEVCGLMGELGIEEVIEGGENRFVHRLPVRAKYGNLVLKRGLLNNSRLIGWVRDAIENFTFQPVDVLVALLNEQHEPLASWSFARVWPVKWVISDFNAQEGSIVIETLELAYSYVTRKS